MTFANMRPEPGGSVASAGPHLVVLAGGVGQRLTRIARVLTGAPTPKQFCRFSSGRSLLEATIERMLPMFPVERVTVVVTGSQVHEARLQLERLEVRRVVVQPCDRGTAAGLLLPLLDLAARAPETTVVVTPADHAFRAPTELVRSLAAACSRVSEFPGQIVLVGVDPDAPRPDLGWIVSERVVGEDFERVIRFEEKPSGTRAAELMACGARVNTLIVAGRVGAMLHLFQRHTPELIEALQSEIELPPALRWQRLERAFAALKPVDLSRDLLAHADNLVVCRLASTAGWTDLGDEARLLAWLEASGETEQCQRILRGLAAVDAAAETRPG